MNNIKFNKSFAADNSLVYIEDALKGGQTSGDNKYTKECHKLLKTKYNVLKPLLVHSGTSALEMQALLCNISDGDEVIMPSFTFVSTANAFVLRGAKPVFVDIRADNLNID